MGEFLQKYRRWVLVGAASLAMGGLFWVISQGEKPQASQKTPSSPISTPQDIMDPREKWTYKIEKINQETLQKVGEENSSLRQEISDLRDRMAYLELEKESAQSALQSPGSPSSFNESALLEKPKMGYLSLEKPVMEEEEEAIRNADTYIPSGTFVPSVLLSGVVVGTGATSQADPQPILIRFVGDGVIPKGSAEGLQDAVLIGSCQGDISSERAYCRLQTLTLREPNGEIIEKDVEGWVIGEDGRPGIKGLVVDRSSEVVRLAMLNGILGGIASFFQQQATAGVYPISPLTGQTNALSGSKMLQAGGYSGATNALDKLADFAIKKAEQMQPVLVIEAGRKVDVVFKKGIDLKEASLLKKQTHSYTKDLLKENTTKLAENKLKEEVFKAYQTKGEGM